MKSFFKYLLASFVALVIFFSLVFIIMIGLFGSLLTQERPDIPRRSVLVVDLSQNFQEKKLENPILELTGNEEAKIPTLHQLVRMIRHAKTDSAIRGIYVVANDNYNGFAASEEIRNALLDFKNSGKFIIAYGDYMTQKSYLVANAADQVYINPKGMFDWRGFSVQYVYFKNLLQKLEINPQIFYDGKFKSATEPFREEKMTPENRLQTNEWLGDIYGDFLSKTSVVRKSDTAFLHMLANRYELDSLEDAVEHELIDGMKYDDEVKDEIKAKLGIADDARISFITPGTYYESGALTGKYQKDKIAVVYAEGEIVMGRGEDGTIAADTYKNIIRKLRYNKDIKAVVLRINSPGGSSLASEIIWREIELTRKAGKPVVVSMGDLAASGGYYIACSADSIFAQPNTLTGSIGVFAVVPDFSAFMKNKLGITFDGVKTATYADALTVTRPMSPQEKRIIQSEVDKIYADFKQRVADGRKKDTTYIDSIAQGRVWTGKRAVTIGLVDRIGNIEDAVRAAASLAGLENYALREFPEPRSPLDVLFGNFGRQYQMKLMREELGDEQYQLLMKIRKIKEQTALPMARMAFDVEIQ